MDDRLSCGGCEHFCDAREGQEEVEGERMEERMAYASKYRLALELPLWWGGASSE